MKRFLLSWALFLCSLTVALAQFSGSGSGTESDPYLIFYADQLSQVRNFLNKDGVYFKLMTDIDLTGWIEENSPNQGWQPIGVEASPFKGIFDGNGHTIKNIIIKRPKTNYVGVFGYANGATFSNLTIQGTIEGSDDVGALAGYAKESSFTAINVDAEVKGNASVGGIVGYNSKGKFVGCKLINGTLAGTSETGGMVGTNQGSSVNTTVFSNCEVHANVSGGNFTGGFAGKLAFGKFSGCIVYGEVSGQDKVGGFVGGITESIYDETKNSSFKHGQADIDSCAYYGLIKGRNSVGGYIGGVDTGDNNLNYYSCARQMNVNNSYVIGDITATGNNVGGLIGDYNVGYGDWAGGTISDSYYSGSLVGGGKVGGLVGNIYLWSGWEPNLTIQNSLSIGTLKGDSVMGGLVGDVYCNYVGTKEHHTGKDIIIKTSVAALAEFSSTVLPVGRIYGRNRGSYFSTGTLGTAEGNLALSTMKVSVSGVVQEITDDEQNGTSMGSTGLKLKANYVAHGWDFNNDWAIQETETYPYKPWQTAPPYVESGLVSQSTTVAGKSVDGGTVYIQIGDDYVDSVKCSGNQFSFTVPALQSGERVRLYAVSEGKWQSPYTEEMVSYPGKGTEANPYLVYTANDLQGVYKRGHYKLMNDIDLTEWINASSPTTGWPAIGKNGISEIYFDGDGHTVSGLWSKTDYEYSGLFSNFPGGSIQNLAVKTAEGKSVSGGVYVGILIGRIANGTISNVTVEGNVASSSANAKVGGVAGEANGGSLTGCQVNVAIEASGDSTMAGGLVGSSSAAVNSSYSQGSVSLTGNGTYAGGLIGQNLAAGTVKDCYSLADVSSKLYSAGLVAYNYGAVSNSYAKGNVSSQYYGAGVVGYNDGASASASGCVAGNPKIDISDQSGWSIRVLGGFKNGAAQPGENNYALNTMILSVNGVTKKASDNILDGYAKTEEVLERQATYEGLGWDFTAVWSIDEGRAWPLLKQGGVVNGIAVAPSPKSTNDNKIYDLQGRRVLKPSRGLYIVNGKKVIIR